MDISPSIHTIPKLLSKMPWILRVSLLTVNTSGGLFTDIKMFLHKLDACRGWVCFLPLNPKGMSHFLPENLSVWGKDYLFVIKHGFY